MDTEFRSAVRTVLSKTLTGRRSARMRDFAWMHDQQFDPHLCEIVYVIMTNRPGNLQKDALPFFSKVNLRMRCHELRRMGFKYSLALVPTS
jgi:uncharacterized protein (TIGR04141 family)